MGAKLLVGALAVASTSHHLEIFHEERSGQRRGTAHQLSYKGSRSGFCSNTRLSGPVGTSSRRDGSSQSGVSSRPRLRRDGCDDPSIGGWAKLWQSVVSERWTSVHRQQKCRQKMASVDKRWPSISWYDMPGNALTTEICRIGERVGELTDLAVLDDSKRGCMKAILNACRCPASLPFRTPSCTTTPLTTTHHHRPHHPHNPTTAAAAAAAAATRATLPLEQGGRKRDNSANLGIENRLCERVAFLHGP
jgi:hypothetical protein